MNSEGYSSVYVCLSVLSLSVRAILTYYWVYSGTSFSGHLPYNGQCQLLFPQILYFKNLRIADTLNNGHSYGTEALANTSL